ncbi:hypothetical protein [Candidatus Thiodictyon syntrophicum]|uniref:hypothetical protein n=1 Tax=Candidatus Thiodictyon syntrophicum TaxID=1166950 RepID=UPI0012FE0390|nr:hypothetical protein [Candidatus Thiodictyon syntrophicum]
MRPKYVLWLLVTVVFAAWYLVDPQAKGSDDQAPYLAGLVAVWPLPALDAHRSQARR